nr:isocitrate lyase/phosphoenolpyruvate mutase family protein [Bradyrhizobium sp. 193]
MSLPKACAPAWPRLAWSTSWPPTAHFRRFSRKAGFDGLWASGFELSAPYGLQDMSLISMTQHLDMLRAIAGRTRLPIVADIDTGYANATSVIHAITEYERAGASAVMIGEAAITARSHGDFLVIARTEALIASLG